jgi:hypothetical protein
MALFHYLKVCLAQLASHFKTTMDYQAMPYTLLFQGE